ncbi:GNAT family N-acetyltransferase [Sellimonas sp.]|uniref:GNAT family N-acetyltransferase n=1 Tax=Sellimonas sp. TaxID=2021466 RepID=UPI00257E56D3|nr:GNAT family protein [Sellimonas sp.]
MKKQFSSRRLIYRLADPAFCRMAAEFFQRNKEILKISEDRKPEEFYLPEFQKIWLEMQREKAEEREWLSFYIFEKRKPGRIIGTVTVSNFRCAKTVSGTIGYRIDLEKQGQGYGTEAAYVGTRIGFDELGLRKMVADVMPNNRASLRVLEKCGYEREGYFRRNIKINGKWEDHIRMVIFREDFQEVPEKM